MNAKVTVYLLGALFFLGSTPGLAVPLTNQCSVGGAISGISTTDVIGNAGGSTDCFGTYNGNDPGPGGSLTFAGESWDFVSKTEDDSFEGDDIGLYYTGGTSGVWGYDSGVNFDSFILVLKAANDPGWAAWLFDGSDAASYSGRWSVAWDHDLSHLSLYASDDEVPVPLPGSAGLLGLALLATGLFARRRRR